MSLFFLLSINWSNTTTFFVPPLAGLKWTAHAPFIVWIGLVTTQFLPVLLFCFVADCCKTTNKEPLASKRIGKIVLPSSKCQVLAVLTAPVTASYNSVILPFTRIERLI